MFSSSLSSRSIIIMILLAKLKISLVCPTNLAFATNLKQFYIDRQRQRKKESEQKKNLTLVGKSWILNCLIIMLECWSNKIFSLLIIQLLFFFYCFSSFASRRKSYQVASSSIRHLHCGNLLCAVQRCEISLLLLTRSFSFSFVIPLNKERKYSKKFQHFNLIYF